MNLLITKFKLCTYHGCFLFSEAYADQFVGQRNHRFIYIFDTQACAPSIYCRCCRRRRRRAGYTYNARDFRSIPFRLAPLHTSRISREKCRSPTNRSDFSSHSRRLPEKGVVQCVNIQLRMMLVVVYTERKSQTFVEIALSLAHAREEMLHQQQ
uniref:Uncharacterized protein n=1 Tax=Trichogramma kaykai TaxID=54128 RepID=A0ABD2X4A9_9HYME